MRLSNLIRADLAANTHDRRSQLVMALFRLAGNPEWPKVAQYPLRVLYKALVIWIFGIELPVDTKVGPGLCLRHATGIVVHPRVVIGAGCELKHACTVGIRVSGGPAPILEDGVDVGAHAQILGGIRLGAGARIGAGAILLIDVPAGASAVGNPARVIGSPAQGHSVDRTPADSGRAV